MSDFRSSFARLVKDAAGRCDAVGWRVRGTGLVYRGDDGCWGQVVFQGATRIQTPRVDLALTAGTCSPYLMRVFDHDPSKPPSRRGVAAHTQLVLGVPVSYRPTGPPIPESFRFEPLVLDLNHPWVELTPDTAPGWLDNTFARLVPATQALCSNAAIYEWLVAPRKWETVMNLRLALLLGRHLGFDAKTRDLEQRAERLDQRDHGTRDDKATQAANRTSRIFEWSHERFMQFLAATAP